MADCHEDSSSGDSENRRQASHDHCNMHCSHHVVYFPSLSTFESAVVQSINFQTYLVYLGQVSLDGPFRPPLA